MEKLTVLPEQLEVQLPVSLPHAVRMRAPDLFESRVLGYDTRAATVRALMLLTLGCAAAGVLLGAGVHKTREELNEIRSTVGPNEYQAAMELQKKDRRLDHGK